MKRVLVTLLLMQPIIHSNAQITFTDIPDQVVMREDTLTYKTLPKIRLIDGFKIDKIAGLNLFSFTNRDTLKFSICAKKCIIENVQLVKLKSASNLRKGTIQPILFYAAFQEGDLSYYQFTATGLTMGIYAIFFADKPNVYNLFKVASNKREKSLPSIDFEF
jgi:hypothetical protein